MQAPHWLVSQPMCVPVRPSVSRRKWTSSSRGSTSACAPNRSPSSRSVHPLTSPPRLRGPWFRGREGTPCGRAPPASLPCFLDGPAGSRHRQRPRLVGEPRAWLRLPGSGAAAAAHRRRHAPSGPPLGAPPRRGCRRAAGRRVEPRGRDHPGRRRGRRARHRDHQRAAAGSRLRLLGGGHRGRSRHLRRACRPTGRPRRDHAPRRGHRGPPRQHRGGRLRRLHDRRRRPAAGAPHRATPGARPRARGAARAPRDQRAARAALAEQALRADAVHNVQRVALLVSSLYTGSVDDLSAALSDKSAPGRPRPPGADVRPPLGARRPHRRARCDAVGCRPERARVVPRGRRRALRRVRGPRGARRGRARDGAGARRALRLMA